MRDDGLNFWRGLPWALVIAALLWLVCISVGYMIVGRMRGGL